MFVAPLTPPESKTKNYFRPTHHVQTGVISGVPTKVHIGGNPLTSSRIVTKR